MVKTAPQRPHPSELHALAFELINARATDYDNSSGIEQNFREIAAMASLVTGKDIRARDVAMVLVCVKLLRSKSCPEKIDNYVDGINYMAFAGCLTGLDPLKLPTKTDKEAVFPEGVNRLPTADERALNVGIGGGNGALPSGDDAQRMQAR